MDLKGYAATKKKAFSELKDLIKMQVSFAMKKNDGSLIFFPAEAKYFDLYEKAREKYFKTFKEDEKYCFEDFPLKEIRPTTSFAYA